VNEKLEKRSRKKRKPSGKKTRLERRNERRMKQREKWKQIHSQGEVRTHTLLLARRRTLGQEADLRHQQPLVQPHPLLLRDPPLQQQRLI
jgi:hypothetical protein